MQDAVLGMNIRRGQRDTLDFSVGKVGTLAVQQAHIVRYVLHRTEGTGDMVLYERLLNNGVALVRLYLLQQLRFIEAAVDGSHDGERLTAIQQVGIADGRLLVHTEHLGLLEHLTEIAQLRVGLQLLPEGEAAASGGIPFLVVVVPL